MNTHTPIRQFHSRLTSKYQATIPKEIRDALSLKTGDLVRFAIDSDGNAVIERADDDAQLEQRRARLIAGVSEARRIYKEQGVDLGMNPVEYVDWIRGPAAEV